jgi:hypothetical protein
MRALSPGLLASYAAAGSTTAVANIGAAGGEAEAHPDADLLGCMPQSRYLARIDLMVFLASRSEWMSRSISDGWK